MSQRNIIVYASLQVPFNILYEAALSFLGVGIRPPTASWGQMIAAATPTFSTAWWYMVFPGAALVLTAGGTGRGPRDRTPEATRRVIDREAPGLAEAMRTRGAERNPYAWLSRGVAGLRGNTLIVNLPGSKRGAEESLASIVPLLRHGLEVVVGGQTHP